MSSPPRNKKQKTGYNAPTTPASTENETSKTPAFKKSAQNTQRNREKKKEAKCHTITGLNILVVVDDGSATPTCLFTNDKACELAKQDWEKAAAWKTAKRKFGLTMLLKRKTLPVETYLHDFQETNSNPWRKYDVLELLLGPTRPSAKESTIDFAAAPQAGTCRINFKEDGANVVATYLRKWGPANVLPLFPVVEGRMEVNGINALLAHFLLELLQKPHLGVDGKIRQLKNGQKMPDNNVFSMEPSVVYTKQSTLLFLLRHHPKEVGKLLRSTFDMLLQGNPRGMTTSDRVMMQDTLQVEFVSVGGRVYPPPQLQKMFLAREELEHTFDNTGYMLEKKTIHAFTYSDKNCFWETCFREVAGTFDRADLTDHSIYKKKNISETGLICKIGSTEDAINRIIILRRKEDAEDARLVASNVEGAAVEGVPMDKTLVFEPYVQNLAFEPKYVFAQMTTDGVKFLYYIDPFSENNKPTWGAPEGECAHFCKEVAEVIRANNPLIVWNCDGHPDVTLRFDVFQLDNDKWFLNQLNLVTTCDTFLEQGAGTVPELALKTIADGIKSYIEARLFSWTS